MSDCVGKYNISIVKYCKNHTRDWDSFVRSAKNSLFMFERSYMDYHSDRFDDYSLMFYDDKKLVALMPACIDNGIISSHAGLTFGGIIVDDTMSQCKYNACIEALIAFLKDQGIKQILYKAIPYIYFRQPAEEDRYALFKVGARIAEVAASTVVNLADPIKLRKGRKSQISRAKRDGVQVSKIDDKELFAEFLTIENAILMEKHGTTAVHTADELYLLHERFPAQIHLFGGFKQGGLIAGVVLYEYDDIIHTQYMAANDEAKQIGALDLVIFEIMNHYKGSKKWLDFGISTEDGGRFLNEGLISQKEGFGGRTVVFEKWRLDLVN